MTNCTESLYHGHKRYDFDFDGHGAIAVVPNSPIKGNPWLFRAEFFGAFDGVDKMLADKGWHIAHVRVPDMFGHHDAVGVMKSFHDFLVEKFTLNQKAVICGMSRGGLYTVNYTAKYPHDVAGLYLDAPVLNIMSWPFGLGKGIGSTRDIELCKNAWGINDSTVLNFRDNPIDKAKALLDNNIPICFICGGADDVVPYEENASELVSIYERAGGSYKLFFKPECGHHPHGLDDPTPAVDYIISMY